MCVSPRLWVQLPDSSRHDWLPRAIVVFHTVTTLSIHCSHTPSHCNTLLHHWTAFTDNRTVYSLVYFHFKFFVNLSVLFSMWYTKLAIQHQFWTARNVILLLYHIASPRSLSQWHHKHPIQMIIMCPYWEFPAINVQWIMACQTVTMVHTTNKRSK